jgi:hypothetical protein
MTEELEAGAIEQVEIQAPVEGNADGGPADVEPEVAIQTPENVLEDTAPDDNVYTPEDAAPFTPASVPDIPATSTDPIEAALAPLAKDLQAFVDSGEISLADAQLRYREQYETRKVFADYINGRDAVSKTLETLSSMGVAPGSALDKEVRSLLKKDFKTDLANPSSCLGLNDPESRRIIADYVIPKAKQDVARRAGAAIKPPTAQGAKNTPPAVGAEPASGPMSVRDVSKMLLGG